MVFSTNCVDTTGYPYVKNEFQSYLTANTKINSKWIKDINVRAKTTEFLEENIEVNLCNLGLDNGLTSKYKQQKK